MMTEDTFATLREHLHEPSAFHLVGLLELLKKDEDSMYPFQTIKKSILA